MSAPCNYIEPRLRLIVKSERPRTNFFSARCRSRFVRSNQQTNVFVLHHVCDQSGVAALVVDQSCSDQSISGFVIRERLRRGQSEIKGNLPCEPCSHRLWRFRLNFERKITLKIASVSRQRCINVCGSTCVRDNSWNEHHPQYKHKSYRREGSPWVNRKFRVPT